MIRNATVIYPDNRFQTVLIDDAPRVSVFQVANDYDEQFEILLSRIGRRKPSTIGKEEQRGAA